MRIQFSSWVCANPILNLDDEVGGRDYLNSFARPAEILSLMRQSLSARSTQQVLTNERRGGGEKQTID